MEVRKTLPLFQDLSDYTDSLTPKLYYFKHTDLGKLYAALPWDELDALEPDKNCGRPSRYSFRFKVALMFLKHYLNVSDEKLIERLNTDVALQFFCGVYINDFQPITDKALLSRIRSGLSVAGLLEHLQMLFAKHWEGYIPDKQVLLMDATCYESHMRYPTDAKLLWESCDQVFEWLFFSCMSLNIRRPRNRYLLIRRAYMSYARRRRKTHKQTRKIKRKLLLLLSQGLEMLQELLNTHKGLEWTDRAYSRLKTIKMVYAQQKYMFDHKVNKVQDRIVSLSRPWVRPIVRGKEVKPVEFGQKAHIIMIGGLCFVEHTSFDSYNECKRLKSSFLYHKKLTGDSCKALSADAIYATNANRRFLTDQGVQTGFVNKGRKKDDKDTKALKTVINKERSTHLEGRFGHHKQAYGLGRIKARTEAGEKLWMFFGVMTANALKVGRVIYENQERNSRQSRAA
jgi:hypothetical protein